MDHIKIEDACPICKSTKKIAFTSVRIRTSYDDYLNKPRVTKKRISESSVKIANSAMTDLAVSCEMCGHKFKVVDNNEDTDY